MQTRTLQYIRELPLATFGATFHMTHTAEDLTD